MKMSLVGARALAGVAAITVVAAPARAADDKPAGKFLQCDGRMGHVSGGERAVRLLLVSATAGISEMGMSKDGADKRVSGAAGVAACDEAMTSENDGYRRMQLALARSIHFGEDKQWAQAAAAAAQVPEQLRDKATDWGLAKSSTSTARYLQALYSVRAGNIGGGEHAAWDGIRIAGPDVITLQRMSHFIPLSRTITPEKRAALMTMLRYYPDADIRVANVFAEAGDFRIASAVLKGFEGSLDAFIKEPKPVGSLHAMMATFAAMNGDAVEANRELAVAKAALERNRSEGEAASAPTAIATQEESIAFAQAAITAASGDATGAAKLLADRGSWPTVAPGVVAILVGRIAPQVAEADRHGVVALGEQAIWDDALKSRLAVIGNTDKDAKLWSVTNILEQDQGYQKLARNALTGSDKPKWLLKPGKEPREFDILSAGLEAPGWEAGEGILYHAALIAKARGKQGFVILPVRARINSMGLRFVNPGELGIPASSIVMADDVISTLSPHIRPATD
jgi:hypothetical protein